MWGSLSLTLQNWTSRAGSEKSSEFLRLRKDLLFMAVDTAWLKAHWLWIVGIGLGLVVVYELLKSLGGGSSAPASAVPDVSGGANQLQALTSAADLQNAQVNGATTIAAYQAGTANTAIAAQLQATEVQTAAALEATNNQTEAAREIGLAGVDAGVQVEQIKANASVSQTAIEGNTITTLGAQREAIANNQINTVGGQINQILNHSKHASQDLTAFAPIIAEETGQGSTAGPLAQANASSRVASSTGATITAGATALQGLNSILSGLFA
jgi:hypothetical protein